MDITRTLRSIGLAIFIKLPRLSLNSSPTRISNPKSFGSPAPSLHLTRESVGGIPPAVCCVHASIVLFSPCYCYSMHENERGQYFWLHLANGNCWKSCRGVGRQFSILATVRVGGWRVGLLRFGALVLRWLKAGYWGWMGINSEKGGGREGWFKRAGSAWPSTANIEIGYHQHTSNHIPLSRRRSRVGINEQPISNYRKRKNSSWLPPSLQHHSQAFLKVQSRYSYEPRAQLERYAIHEGRGGTSSSIKVQVSTPHLTTNHLPFPTTINSR